MESCPTCGQPYGKRRRCYRCQPGKRRSGKYKDCPQCGSRFYVPAWKLRDTERRQGTYCSIGCFAAAKKRVRKKLAERPAYVNRQGYVMIPISSGRGQNNYRAEHRLVMEAQLGRPLYRFEHVHHINGDKADNRIGNLLLLTNSEHQKVHDFPQTRSRRLTFTCQECGKQYERAAHRLGETKYCSMSCRSKAVSRERWRKAKGI